MRDPKLAHILVYHIITTNHLYTGKIGFELLTTDDYQDGNKMWFLWDGKKVIVGNRLKYVPFELPVKVHER